MTSLTLKEIEQIAVELPKEDKVSLIRHIEESLSPQEHEQVWAEEAAARLDALRDNRATARNASDVLDELRETFLCAIASPDLLMARGPTP